VTTLINRTKSCAIHILREWVTKPSPLPDNTIPVAFATALLLLAPLTFCEAATLYVKHDASGTNNGSSWTDAYTDLQTALTNAMSGDEIWVAAGIYKPTTGTDVTATFQLKNDVAIYGGFTGTEDSLDQRDWGSNKTVLSGDIDNNDTTDANGIITSVNDINGDNAQTIVTGSGTDNTSILDGFVITGGLANGDDFSSKSTGAGMLNNAGSPTLANLIFIGNFASSDDNGYGGGIFNYESSPALTNVTFSGNEASWYGGGMINYSNSSPTLTNITFSSNVAYLGGGMSNFFDSSPTLTNVSFSSNNAYSGGGMYNYSNSNPTLNNVIFWGNTATDSSASQILNDGSNSDINYSLIQGGCDSIADANCGDGNIDADPLFVDAANGNLRLQAASPAIDGGNNSVVSMETDLDGNTRIFDGNCDGIDTVDMGAYEYTGTCHINIVMYVKHDATGNNNGSSWTDAYTDLQTALTNAINGDEIWVTAGIYKPTTGTDVTATFQLKDGVAIYGGFTGTETAREQRDWGSNKTVLSGDVDNDDTTDANGIITSVNNINGDNAQTIVTGSGTGNTAILDGFVITGGLGDGNAPPGLSFLGAGIFNSGGSPTLANLVIIGNFVNNDGFGGGMANLNNSSPTLTNVTFTGNKAGSGGGMHNQNSSNPTLINVTFSGNEASNNFGGGMLNIDSSPALTNVTFSGNEANSGGGMSNFYSSPALTNVSFSGNKAQFAGGMSNFDSSPTLFNVAFSSNEAESGGGMYNDNNSSPALTNVTFSGNEATRFGDGIVNNYSSSPTLNNVILWGNASEIGDQIYNLPGSNPNINYSLIQGGCASIADANCGSGNIDADPMFVDAANGNLRLQAGSPAIDGGNNSVVFSSTDMDGNTRFFDGNCNSTVTVDMGVYEYIDTCQSNLNIINTPDTSVQVAANYNFTPIVVGADGASLTFSITNQPTWANFDTSTGALTGIPTIDDLGTTSNIEISVFDGSETVSLSAFLTVVLDRAAIVALFWEREGTNNPLNEIFIINDPIFYADLDFADIDNDGDLDIFIGELEGTIKYYQNTGTAFVEQTGTANPFNGVDLGLYSSPALVDIDSDGDLDAFLGNGGGAVFYYKNIGTASTPNFEVQNGTANPFDDMNFGLYSKPTFVDIDQDGDFDAFIGSASVLESFRYYKNTGTANSPTFEEQTGAAHPFNGIDFLETFLNNSAFIDIDHDGDFDAFLGQADGTIDYYENMGTARKPHFIQQHNPLAGVDVGSNAAPTFVDLDKDGDWDAVIGEQNATIHYYENIAPVTGGRFINQQLVFKGISVSGWSQPSLVDIDQDGDLDAFFGETEGKIHYYKNVGTANSPTFDKQTGESNPFNGVDVGQFSHITFGDIDADGDWDAFIGEEDGIIKYYQNTGTISSPSFAEQTGAANPLNGVNFGTNSPSKPTLVDIDQDGDLDAFIGHKLGMVLYYKNQGTASVPNFVEQLGADNPLDNVDVGENNSPTFVDMDKDGDFDVFIGEKDGVINYYENTGTINSPSFVARTGVANPFVGVNVGNFSVPFLADIDNDGNLDALIGESNGTIQHYEYTYISNALPRGGEYNFTPQVYLKCVKCDGFYYTLDGTTPTTASAQYIEPIAIPADTTTTLKFISVTDDVESEVFTETYLIDTQAPTVAITAPDNQAELASLSAIQGTVADIGIGVGYVELQVTNGSSYLAEDGSFVLTATWVPATGTDNWTLDTNDISFPPGEYTITVRAFDKVDNISEEQSINVNIGKGFTELYLETSAATILNSDTLDIVGKLNRFPETEEDLSGIEIVLTITAPDGTTQVTQTTTTHTDTGQFKFENVLLPNLFDPMQEGAFGFQVTFAGNSQLAASESVAEAVLVGASAGYAILVQGKIQNEEGLAAHNKTIHRIFQKFKKRGFEDDNIKYFNYDTTQEGVDGLPVKSDIIAAFTDLQGRMNSNPAPFYVVMVDHGGVDGRFHIYNGHNDQNDVISATELAGWLYNFDVGLNDTALQKPRLIILGACYSGSFIPKLSETGRIIMERIDAIGITAQTTEEPDGIRSGEYFMEEFFQRLGKGDNIRAAFEFATERTETFTRQGGDANSINPFHDNATQHPLLDDNGDGQGSNTITTDNDGQHALEVFLGAGLDYDTNSADNPAEILSVSDTIYLGADEFAATLTAKVNDANSVNSAPVDIRKPSVQLHSSGTEQSEQLEISDLQRVFMNCSAVTQTCTTYFDQFVEPGQYEAFYFVRDNETNDISPIKRSVIYKDYAGNTPPSAFDLISPDNNSEHKTTLLFEWAPATDADGQVTYNLLLSTDENFNTIVYKQEELTTTMSYIDEAVGLEDQTTYYWKVEAVDPYGARTTSTQEYTFNTNNTNAPPTVIRLFIFNKVTSEPVINANIEFSDVSSQPIIHKDQGYYETLLPQEEYQAVVQADEFEPYSTEFTAARETVLLRIDMTPTAGIPIQPGQLQLTTSSLQIDEIQGNLNILVERVSGRDGVVSVDYSTVNGSASAGSDYIHTSGTLSWTENDDGAKTIILPIRDDDAFEGDETFTMMLSNPTGGATLGTSQMTVTIRNNDTAPPPPPTRPGVLQFSASTYIASEGDNTPDDITVTRTGGSDNSVSVQYLTTGESTATVDSDYIGDSGTLTWSTGDDNPKSLNIELIDDEEIELTETLKLILINPTGGAGLGSQAQATLSITDNDNVPSPGTLQFSASSYSASEGDSTPNLTVIRTDGSEGEVSVQYMPTVESTATLGSDYLGSGGTLSWADGDSEAKSLTLTLIDDEEIENAENVHFILFDAKGGATLGTLTETSLIINDNESTDLASLGSGTAIFCQGTACTVTITAPFRGGVSVDDQDYQAQLTLSESQLVKIKGEFEVEASHVGQSAELLIVAGFVPPAEPDMLFLMLDEQRQALLWDGDLTTLIAAEKDLTLAAIQPIDIYQGGLIEGYIVIFFGYRLENGLVVYNGEQTIDIWVEPDR